ncbi:uncharacterized protein [Nicotiana tomentosiformis]|uniref:uncharacterized protein n=1 Tax=Nicotiana tomentosiformis TaxID=4098 RepID=UPI00388CA4D3
MVAFTQATENRKLKNRIEREGSSKDRSVGNFGGSFGGGGGRTTFRGGSSVPSQSFAQSSVSAQPSGPCQQQWSHFRPGQGNRGSYQHGRPGGRFRQQRRPPCPRGTAQPVSSASTTSATPPPARDTPTPAGRGAARGGAQSLGGPNRFYAMKDRHSSEASQDVVIGILTIQYHDVYAFIDPGSTLSYVTPYVAMKFGIEPKLYESFSVSTSNGESIMAVRVYRDCVVMVRCRKTMVDLIELGKVNFDVIIGMDWLYSCFAKLDCRTRTVRFEFPNEPII